MPTSITIIRRYELNGKSVSLWVKHEPYGYSVGYQAEDEPVEIANGFFTLRAAVKHRNKIDQLFRDLGATPKKAIGESYD